MAVWRFLIRFLKILIAVTGSVILLVLITIGVIAAKPSLVLNERTANWAIRYLDQKDLAKIEWESAKIEATKPRWDHLQLKLDLAGVCFSPETEADEVCFKSVKVDSEWNLLALPPKLVRAQQIKFEDGDVSWTVPASEKKSEEEVKKKKKGDESSNILPKVPEFLKDAELGEVLLAVDRARITMSDQVWNGSVRLSGPDWRLVAKAKTPKKQSLSADLRAKSVGKRTLGYQLSAMVVDGKRKLRAVLNGKVDEDSLQGKLAATATGVSQTAPQVRVQDCNIGISVPRAKRDGGIKLHCPIAADLKLPTTQGFPDLKLPTHSAALVKADLDWKQEIAELASRTREKWVGEVSVDVEPLVTPLFEGRLNAISHVNGGTENFPESLNPQTHLAARVRVPQFENLVKELDRTAWAIPAPVRVLKGEIALGAEGDWDWREAQLPIFLRTRLTSDAGEKGWDDQKLWLDGSGALSYSREKSTHLDFDLKLSNVKLALPPVDLAAPPRLFPDARIADAKKLAKEKKAAAKKSESSAFTYQVRILTPDGHPLQVVSNLAQNPIPISLNFGLSSNRPVEGQLAVMKFPLQLFRRDAKVEHFNLQMTPNPDLSPIDGKISVAYADYTVFVNLIGTAKQPEIRLTSEPPLPEDQLTAVLIFGRPLEELDSSETESAGNARAAFADGALSLASLYVLASTPVESVGYDPSTGNVTAKVKLAEGTSLNVGGGQSSALDTVGVRKRLSKFWTITTDVGQTQDQDRKSVTAFLEWRNRY